MSLTNIEMFQFYGAAFLIAFAIFLVVVLMSNLTRVRMILACNSILKDKTIIKKVAADLKTKDYLLQHKGQDLYRVNEIIEKRGPIVKYNLCLEKRSFNFYLKRKAFWNYEVVAVKID